MKFTNRIFYFLTIFLYLDSSLANDVPIFISKKTQITPTLSFSKGEYEDVRVAGDSVIWSLRKGNVSILSRYTGGKISSMIIRRIQKPNVIEVHYSSGGTNSSSLFLTFYSKRPLEVYNSEALFEDSPNQSLCQIRQDGISRLAALKNNLNEGIASSTVNNFLMDSSCTSSLANGRKNVYDDVNNSPVASDAYQKLTIGIARALKFKRSKGTSESPVTSFTDCLKRPETLKQFSAIPNIKEDLALIEAKYTLALAKMYQGDSKFKAIIKCKNDPSAKAKATCSEDGVITFNNVVSNAATGKIEDFQKLFMHELIHSAGVKDTKANDSFIDALIKSCVQGDTTPFRTGEGIGLVAVIEPARSPASISQPSVSKPSNTKTSTIIAPNTKSNQISSPSSESNTIATAPTTVPRSTSTEQIGAPIANEIAEPISTANSFTQQNMQSTETQSYNQSSPMFNFANLVTGATQQATATPKTLATLPSNSDTVSTNVYGSNGLKPGEHVVEEINVSDRKVAASSSSRTSSTIVAPDANLSTPTGIVAPTAGISNDTLAAAGVKTFPTQAKAADSIPQANSSGGGDPFLAAANSAAANAPTEAEQPQIQAKARSTNSARSPSSFGSARAVSRDELTSFFLNGKYSSAKQLLEDKKYQADLTRNDITVLDLKGNRFGATKGTIIILDQGDRFVRQK